MTGSLWYPGYVNLIETKPKGSLLTVSGRWEPVATLFLRSFVSWVLKCSCKANSSIRDDLGPRTEASGGHARTKSYQLWKGNSTRNQYDRYLTARSWYAFLVAIWRCPLVCISENVAAGSRFLNLFSANETAATWLDCMPSRWAFSSRTWDLYLGPITLRAWS